MNEWSEIIPKVKPEAEFIEIATDFGDPLELLREAISNSIDHSASLIKIHFFMEEIDGEDTLVIEIEDNGTGMSKDQLTNNFWDLGNSSSKLDKEKIGEKGHGTKIFLRSKRIKVITYHATGSFESVCENPFKILNSGEIHKPKIREIEKSPTYGTKIRIEGYNQNERSRYLQSIVKDYIYWFTKFGSFENEFKDNPSFDFKILLKCLDFDNFEGLEFGHKFPKENNNLNELFEKYNTSAGDYFVKKYIFASHLDKFPEIKYEAVIYIEGDQAKRDINPLLRRKKISEKGYYKVADRYGLWLAKDFMPIQRVNEWVTSFGTGSNSYMYIHGFINCQNFKLTANRGSIANTNPEILDEIKNIATKILSEINKDLTLMGLYAVSKWADEERTLEIEKAEFKQRKNSIALRKIAKINNRNLLEPLNESELFGLFITIYNLFPDKFDFEPLDYNTTRGIDIIGRNKTDNKISDCEYWYVELKYKLSKSFNHSFKYTRWIICWDFENDIKHETEIISSIGNEKRTVKYIKDLNKEKITYFLEKPTEPIRICIIRLKEFLEKELGLKFEEQ